jgi:hypothetical protein
MLHAPVEGSAEVAEGDLGQLGHDAVDGDASLLSAHRLYLGYARLDLTISYQAGPPSQRPQAPLLCIYLGGSGHCYSPVNRRGIFGSSAGDWLVDRVPWFSEGKKHCPPPSQAMYTQPAPGLNSPSPNGS